MHESLQFMLFAAVGGMLWAVCFWWRVIGVRGGSASRDENPVAYWLGMGVLGFGSIACAVIAIVKGYDV